MKTRTVRAWARWRGWIAVAGLTVTVALTGTACDRFAIGQTALLQESPAMRPASLSQAGGDTNLMHGDCRYCHLEGSQVVRSKPSTIPHQVDGTWATCSTCHADGRLAPMPVQHGGASDTQCQMCHKQTATPPPEMAHLAFPGKTCTSCHGPTVALPASHANRAEYTCQLCHKPAAIPPPAAPHIVSETQACSSCHAAGTPLALPTSHAGRTDKLCVLCHQQKAGGTPSIPHTLDNRQDCLECHLPKSGSGQSSTTSTIR